MPRRADFRQALVAREWPLLSAGDGGEAGPDGELRFVLEHTAGPAAPAGGVFTSPTFPSTSNSLRCLRERGMLVAGGPLPDRPGTGMTVVRVADPLAAEQVVSDAQHEDGSVTSGLLDVTVRPWRWR
ncbi:hypothetical protein [Georgenia deserti]|uniref:YCII-related domain-containing protein n=1 Tax=Georgenia deserti TaxID=2093781 RepID=A0ABW4L8A1_9MICO